MMSTTTVISWPASIRNGLKISNGRDAPESPMLMNAMTPSCGGDVDIED